jgi:hypothetical protein
MFRSPYFVLDILAAGLPGVHRKRHPIMNSDLVGKIPVAAPEFPVAPK